MAEARSYNARAQRPVRGLARHGRRRLHARHWCPPPDRRPRCGVLRCWHDTAAAFRTLESGDPAWCRRGCGAVGAHARGERDGVDACLASAAGRGDHRRRRSRRTCPGMPPSAAWAARLGSLPLLGLQLECRVRHLDRVQCQRNDAVVRRGARERPRRSRRRGVPAGDLPALVCGSRRAAGGDRARPRQERGARDVPPWCRWSPRSR